MSFHRLKGSSRHCVFGIVTAPREAMLMPDLQRVQQGSGIEHQGNAVQLGYPRIGGVLRPQNLHLTFVFWIDRHLMYQLFHPIPRFLRTTTFRSQQTTTQLFSPDIDFFYALGNNDSSHAFTFFQPTKSANC